MADLALESKISTETLYQLGYQYFESEDKWEIGDFACDYIFINTMEINFKLPGTLGVVQAYSVWKETHTKQHYPKINPEEYLNGEDFHPELNFIYLTLTDLSDKLIEKIKKDPTTVLLIDTYNEHGMAEQRQIFSKLLAQECTAPVIIGRYYRDLSL